MCAKPSSPCVRAGLRRAAIGAPYCCRARHVLGIGRCCSKRYTIIRLTALNRQLAPRGVNPAPLQGLRKGSGGLSAGVVVGWCPLVSARLQSHCGCYGFVRLGWSQTCRLGSWNRIGVTLLIRRSSVRARRGPPRVCAGQRLRICFHALPNRPAEGPNGTFFGTL